MKITLQHLLTALNDNDKILSQIKGNIVFPPKDSRILLPSFLDYKGSMELSIAPYIWAHEKMRNMLAAIAQKMVKAGGQLEYTNHNDICINMLNMQGIVILNITGQKLHLLGVDEREKEIIRSWSIEVNSKGEIQ